MFRVSRLHKVISVLLDISDRPEAKAHPKERVTALQQSCSAGSCAVEMGPAGA